MTAGAAPATVPPPASPAPHRRRSPIVAFLLSPVDPATWRAVLAIGLGFLIAVVAFSIVTTLFSMGGSLLIVVVGFALVALGIEAARLTARVERWRMAFVDETRPLIPHPYRTAVVAPREPYGPWLRTLAEAAFLDGSRWLDVVYVLVAFPLAIIEFVVAVTLWALATGLLLSPLILLVPRPATMTWYLGRLEVEPAVVVGVTFVIGLVLLPVAASVTRGLAIAHRYVVEGLLCISPAEALRRDNERLRESRSATIELEASELRRIERDLHDGAQQRLVMLAIDLTLAEDKVDADPEGAKALIAGARDQARQALAELRDVVRGSAPAILLDRGLAAALSAVAGRSPVPVFVDSQLAPNERLPHGVERAAYYVFSEALVNVAKHAGATRIDARILRQPGWLLVEVRDNGTGGATVVPGGGLAGLRDRVQALDGQLDVMSPPGGPTILRVSLPVPLQPG
jgi:signal transduction histidine kinase